MKTFKRITAVILAALMLMSIVPAVSYADDAHSFSVRIDAGKYVDGVWQKVTTAKAGDTINARVYMESDFNCYSFGAIFFYDKAVFEDSYGEMSFDNSILGPDYKWYSAMIQSENTYMSNTLVSSGQLSESEADRYNWIYISCDSSSITGEKFSAEGYVFELTLNVKEEAEIGSEGFIKALPGTFFKDDGVSYYFDIQDADEGGLSAELTPQISNAAVAVTDGTESSGEFTTTISCGSGTFTDYPDKNEFTVTAAYGSVIDIPAVTAPEGTTFAGWVDSASGTVYAPDEPVILLEDLSLTAKYACTDDNHTPAAETKENIVAPTCTKDGSHDSVVYCSVCGAEISRETVTDSAYGHDYTNNVTYDWSKNYSACTATAACNNCGETVTANGSVANPTSVPATCYSEGYNIYAAVFIGYDFKDIKVVSIPKIDHTPADAVKENEVAATCTSAGSYDSVVYCSVCNAEISRETVTVDATGHEYEITYTWSEDGKTCTAKAVCKNDSSDVITETATATGKVASPAACETNGSTAYTVTFSNPLFASQSETLADIPATNHADNDNDGVCDSCSKVIDSAKYEKYLLDKVIIRTASSASVLWKNDVTVAASAENVPEGYVLKVTTSKGSVTAAPDANGKCTVKAHIGSMTRSENVTVTIEKDGQTASNNSGELKAVTQITVKDKFFFDKILAFFKFLFKFFKRPTQTISY